MQRIGLYGGTFNPPHIGHITGAKFAMEALKLDCLLVIPAREAPHKVLPEGSASPEQRLEMLHMSVEDCDKISVCDLELNREGPSYTYETVESLHQQYPDSQLVLLMGTDMFLSFLNWRHPERILACASLGVMFRGEKNEQQAVELRKREMEEMGANVEVVYNHVTEISSSDLRRMLVFGCASPFLPNGVEAYIRRNGLYGADQDYRNLPMEQLEQTVVRLLKPNRVAHVLGCRDTAIQLARRWGANEEDAARAGILHDITKALDGPLQLTLCAEYGTILDDFSVQYPKTLHALTGSLVAQRVFGENQAVVDAIQSHTTGKANMNLLEKIIYVADYMEPCRNFPGVERLRELAFVDLDAALKLGLEMTLEHLKTQGSEVSPESLRTLSALN